MTDDPGRLTHQERRSLFLGPVYRILGTPIVAILGLANTAIIVRETGAEVFGLVSLIATMTLFFPFADLGIGATVLSASARLTGPARDPQAVNVIRRAYHVLIAVAALLVLLALGVMAMDGWGPIIGFSSGPNDRWAITMAACIFAVSIPGSLGLRILIGIDRNPLSTLILMICPAFALGLVLVLYAIGADGIWYCVTALGGLVIGEVIGTVLALRLTGLGWSAFSRVGSDYSGPNLLAGSVWLFIVGAGMPVSLQAGRILLAHVSTPIELSQYALMSQFYGLCSTLLATAGVAFWPIFVKRQGESDVTVRMWWQLTAAFAGLAVIATGVLVLLSPPVATLLSGSRIEVSASLALAFGILLVVQSAHLPSNVLLTRPNEARWQALWTLPMIALTIGLTLALAARYGAVGAVYASVVAILLAQVIPDLAWVPRLVRRRPVGDAAEASPGVPPSSPPDPRRE